MKYPGKLEMEVLFGLMVTEGWVYHHQSKEAQTQQVWQFKRQVESADLKPQAQSRDQASGNIIHL